MQNSQENTSIVDFLKNILEQFPKANFAILFSSENIQTENGSSKKIEAATGGAP